MPQKYTLVAEKCLNNMIDSEMAEVGVCLSAADEKDWLASDIGHRESGSDFVILIVVWSDLGYLRTGNGHIAYNGIELRQDDPINPAFSLSTTEARTGEVFECSIKLCELIHGLIAYERFPNEDDLVWVVDRNQLR